MKGSQFPRSYYRCSHSNCTVRKIVERDPRHGSVASAVYKVTPRVVCQLASEPSPPSLPPEADPGAQRLSRAASRVPLLFEPSWEFNVPNNGDWLLKSMQRFHCLNINPQLNKSSSVRFVAQACIFCMSTYLKNRYLLVSKHSAMHLLCARLCPLPYQVVPNITYTLQPRSSILSCTFPNKWALSLQLCSWFRRLPGMLDPRALHRRRRCISMLTRCNLLQGEHNHERPQVRGGASQDGTRSSLSGSAQVCGLHG